MADIVPFPKRPPYDVVDDLSVSIAELCDGLDAVVVVPALTTNLIEVIAQCIKPEGHAEVLRGLAKLLKEGVAVAMVKQ
jgi:hypothetical protein